jgi:hypothetical protein
LVGTAGNIGQSRADLSALLRGLSAAAVSKIGKLTGE